MLNPFWFNGLSVPLTRNYKWKEMLDISDVTIGLFIPNILEASQFTKSVSDYGEFV